VVAVVLLRPVSDQLEPADDLANGEEANDLRRYDANGHPLCVRHAADLGHEVLGCGVGRHALDAVEQGRGLLNGVHRWLHVGLHCLDGSVTC
jgi:hypothetical protein